DSARRWGPPVSAARLPRFRAGPKRVPPPPPAAEAGLIAASAPLIQPRIATLAEAPAMLGFLFVDEAKFTIDPMDAAKALTPDAEPVLAAAEEALAGAGPWTHEAIERALRSALEEGLGLKPRAAVGGAGRGASTGRRVRPPRAEAGRARGAWQ